MANNNVAGFRICRNNCSVQVSVVKGSGVAAHLAPILVPRLGIGMRSQLVTLKRDHYTSVRWQDSRFHAIPIQVSLNLGVQVMWKQTFCPSSFER